MTEAAKKKEHLYIHIIITVFFMFGFGYLPAPEPITVLGMKMLGVFLGLIYAWSFSTLLWPSLMGILALVTNGYLTLKAFLTVGFANDTVVFLLFIFIFTAAVEKEGVTTCMANWCISRKILTGRPWLLSFSLLVGQWSPLLLPICLRPSSFSGVSFTVSASRPVISPTKNIPL